LPAPAAVQAPLGLRPTDCASLAGSLRPEPENTMVISVHQAIAPLIALIAGILILLVPRILNYVIALYLILIGLLGLFGGRLSL